MFRTRRTRVGRNTDLDVERYGLESADATPGPVGSMVSSE